MQAMFLQSKVGVGAKEYERVARKCGGRGQRGPGAEPRGRVPENTVAELML